MHKFTLALLGIVMGLTSMVQAADVVVLSGGEADRWRHVLAGPWGEHLMYGPEQLMAARRYYYRGLTDYANRFDRYLSPMSSDTKVQCINLDRNRPKLDLSGVDVVVLDDVRASALEEYQKQLGDWVKGGGRLLVHAGTLMLGGGEIQTLRHPKLPNDLLFDPITDPGPFNKVPWCVFTTTSSHLQTPLMDVMPVKIISEPDLVVYNREQKAGGRPLAIRDVDSGSFLPSLPMDDWQLFGYHKVALNDGAKVIARIGPMRDPLLVAGKAGKGTVWVFTGNELERCIRDNGQPSAFTVVTPVAGEERLLWDFADVFYRSAVRALLEEPGPQLTIDAPSSLAVGTPLELTLSTDQALPAGTELTLTVEPIGDHTFVRPDGVEEVIQTPAAGQRTVSVRSDLTRGLAEGDFRVVVSARRGGKDKEIAVAAQPLTMTSAKGIELGKAERWAVPQDGKRNLKFAVTSDRDLSDVQLNVALTDDAGRVFGRSSVDLGDLAGGKTVRPIVTAKGELTDDIYTLQTELTAGGTLLARTNQPIAVRDQYGTPDMFMMIAGASPSWPVYKDMQAKRAVMTVQEGHLDRFLPYMELFGGIPRQTTHPGDRKPELLEKAEWKDWTGKTADGGWGGKLSWGHPDVLDYRAEEAKKRARKLAGKQVTNVLLLDDEPIMAMKGGWELADLFKERTGLEAPTPKPLYDDQDYLDHWTKWEEFRTWAWGEHYRRQTEAIHEVAPNLRTAVVIEGMGKDIYAGFDPAVSQRHLDIYWFHIYPLNEPFVMVAHSVQRGMSAMRAMGEDGKDKEPWALMQNWACASEVPHVPQVGYIREQYWMAIAHGVDALGYWPYAYGWWISPGSEAWDEMGRLSDVQQAFFPLWRQLEPARQPIGLLYSTSQGGVDHLRGLLAETGQDAAQPWHNWHANEEAYYALKSGQLPFETVEESELIATGGKLPYKAIVLSRVTYLRPEARKAIRAFQDAGGTVVADKSTTIDLPDIQRIDGNYDSLFYKIFPEDSSMNNRYKHREYYKETTAKHIVSARKALARFDDGLVKIEHPQVVWHMQNGGDARYLFVINDAVETENIDQHAKLVQNWRLTPATWHPVKTKVTVDHDGPIYSLRQSKQVTAGVRGPASFVADLDGGDGQVYVLLDKPIDRVAASFDDDARAGESLAVGVKVLDGNGRTINAALPVKVTLAGRGREVTEYTATSAGQAETELFIGADLPAGRYTLTVTELASGTKTTEDVTIHAAEMTLLSGN